MPAAGGPRRLLLGVRVMSTAYRASLPQAFERISHAILHDRNRAADLKRIAVPTLVVASPDDPGMQREVSELMPPVPCASALSVARGT